MSDGIEVNQPEQLGDDINQMVADNMTDMQAVRYFAMEQLHPRIISAGNGSRLALVFF